MLGQCIPVQARVIMLVDDRAATKGATDEDGVESAVAGSAVVTMREEASPKGSAPEGSRAPESATPEGAAEEAVPIGVRGGEGGLPTEVAGECRA